MKKLLLIMLFMISSCDEAAPTEETIEDSVVAKKTSSKEEIVIDGTTTIEESVETVVSDDIVDEIVSVPTTVVAFKLTSTDCIDPDLSKVSTDTQLMLCDGTIAAGTYVQPAPPVLPDLTLLTANNIRKDVVINGVTGNVIDVDSLATCSSYSDTDCRKTSVHAPANLTANNIRKDIIIAGVTGTVVDASSLANLYPENIVKGVTIGGIAGNAYTMKNLDCRNSHQIHNGGQPEEFICEYSNWEEITFAGQNNACHNNSTNCLYKEVSTGKMFARASEVKTRDSGILYCQNLTFASYDDWRLPTAEEMITAGNIGLIEAVHPNFFKGTGPSPFDPDNNNKFASAEDQKFQTRTDVYEYQPNGIPEEQKLMSNSVVKFSQNQAHMFFTGQAPWAGGFSIVTAESGSAQHDGRVICIRDDN